MANSFSDILKEAKALFSKEKVLESVIGLDIGTSAIKVVQLKKRGGKAILETYGTLALGPYQAQPVGSITNLPTKDIVQAISDIVREAGVTVSEGGIAIPSNSSLLFTLELPANISEKELPTIIPTEARKFIPVPISEVLLDYWIIPKQEDSVFEKKDDIRAPLKNEVLTVAIHNDTIAQYKDILTQAKITNPIFELEVFSAIRSVMSNDLSPTLFIDLGASKTKLSIIEYGIVRTFHVVGRGGADITRAIAQSLGVAFSDAEELKRAYGLVKDTNSKGIDEIIMLSLNYIFSETSSVVFNYEKKTNKTISKIILSGGGALLKGILEASQEHFSAEVALARPFSKVEAPAFLTPVLGSIGPEFSVALGVALRKIQ
jgi:type IV pilus assembly protein PilM